jgi:single-stranded DNA-binding protein
MLSALITGSIASDPKHGTSKTGTEWANCVVRVPCGQNRETGDQESAFVQVAAFGDEAGKLARLTKGDSLSAQGSLKPTTYTKDGQERHGLSLTASGILTAYGIAKKRGDGDSRKSGGTEREQIKAYDAFARGVKVPRQAGDFDDPITF